MATPFHTLDDVTLVGFPASAFGTITTAQKNACVEWTNDDIGARLAGRYPGINVNGGAGYSWDSSVRYNAVAISQKRMLDVRGRNPATASADKLIDERAQAAEKFFDQVQRQASHPSITGGEAAGATSQGPTVLSTSTGYTNSGETLANRGI